MDPLLGRARRTCLGEVVWRIKPKVSSFEERFLPTGFQPTGFGVREARGAILATTAILAASIGSSFALLRSHAGWTVASEWTLEQSGEALRSDRSIVTPFFYALGAWPRMFEGKPVFYSLPYAKGPPDLFVGQVIARWDASAVRLVFEGPKTPPALAGGYDPREMLRQCLTSLSGGEFGAFRCLRARGAALDRHLREMEALEPKRFSIRWLTVRNPAIAAREQVQG
ncbi:MAG TPA: hypothetical protein VM598_04730, partial [Bdellovibrionota bacterium]|nr:hypothetical protein [Bdellovibrionota bacterium]